MLALQEPVDHRAHGTHLGVVGVTRVAGTRPDDDQVGGVEDRAVPLGVVRVVTDDAAGQAQHAQDVAQHVDEVVLAVEHHDVLAAQPRVGRRVGLVGEPERRQPAVAGVENQ